MHLDHMTMDSLANGQASCALGYLSNGHSACTAAYVWSSISLAATVGLAMVLMLTCNCCGLGFLLDGIFGAAGTIWWAILAAPLTQTAQLAATQAMPNSGWRQTVVLLSWLLMADFALLVLCTAVRLLARCCGCCGGGSTNQGDVEAGHDARVVVVPVTAMPPPKQEQFVRGQAPVAGQQPYWTTPANGPKYTL